MGRVRLAARNILFGYVGQITTSLLSFVLRTIFIHYLSRELLGINSLYTSILSILSMAELGIGTALNYALYRPVAEHDTEKIKSYMQMYRRAYWTIGLVVAGIGLAISPFLRYLVNKPGAITVTQMTIYYFIFLFNTVISYFVAYKYSLCNAEQKNYIQTNIQTVTKLVSTMAQIIVIVATQNFLLYLLTDAFVQVAQKFFVNWYLNRLYPYLCDKKIKPLSKEESGEIWTKTKALILHRVGDTARLQTDSLIISSMIEVAVSGMVDNYTMVINTVSNFINVIFSNLISGFGNMIATESEERQYGMFRVYRFCAVWIYGLVGVGFYVLLTPLIRIWIGESWVLPSLAVNLLILDLFFKGDRVVLSNFKTAAGVFEPDKYLALIQGVVNLILSIWLVKPMGLAGIYVGTVISGLIANITKPIIIYRVCFHRGAKGYFIDGIRHYAFVGAVAAICKLISRPVIHNLNILTFVIMFLIIIVIYNGVFVLLYHRTEEFAYMKGILHRRRS